MSGGEFTKGPWEVEYLKGFRSEGNVLAVLNADRYPTAMVPAWDAPRDGEAYAADEAKANARLIAAAPDMLEALQAVVDGGVLIGAGEEAVSPRAMKLVRAALSRASGKEA